MVGLASKLNITLKINRQAKYQEEPSEDLEEIRLSTGKLRISDGELESCLAILNSNDDWKSKAEAIEEIHRRLADSYKLSLPPTLVQKVLDLTYDYNFKTCHTAMNILLTLVSHYSEAVADELPSIQSVTLDKICDLKMAVRQVANKILRKLHGLEGA